MFSFMVIQGLPKQSALHLFNWWAPCLFFRISSQVTTLWPNLFHSSHKKCLHIGSMFDLGPSTLQFTEEYRWPTYFLFFPLFFFGLWFLGTDFSRLVSFFILFSDWIFLGLFTDFDFLGWVAPRGTDARFPSTVFGFRVDGSTCTSSTSSVARVEVVTTMVVSPSSYVVVSATMKPKEKTML